LAAVLGLAAIALLELHKMAVRQNAGVYFITGALPVIALCLAAYFPARWPTANFIASVTTLSVLIEGILRHKNANCLPKTLFTLFAFCYIGVLFSQLILLRNLWPDAALATVFGRLAAGEAIFWLTIIGVWASDTFAYFVGTAFGRHKLCPVLSPNKSWEGAAGGFIGCVAAVWLLGCQILGLGDFNMPTAVFPASLGSVKATVNLPLLGALIGIAAPLGDLAESQLKRFCSVKDSGGFFPGPGGVLDRLDSLLFAEPAVYAYLTLRF
jgi:phosphatidate cytidylyltransferase